MGNKKNNKKKMKQASEKAKVSKAAEKKKNKNVKKPNHPPSSGMVLQAIASLRERKGSSLYAIKKYIAATFHVDMAKQATYIKKYIKSAIEKNEIVQTKGNGASGKFRLPTKADLQQERQKNMPKKPPSKKQAPVKPPAASKKSEARKNTGGKGKSQADKKGAKSNAPKAQKSGTKNSRK